MFVPLENLGPRIKQPRRFPVSSVSMLFEIDSTYYCNEIGGRYEDI
jgi:hypothetical protein